jgi:uncharacterized membrane protein
MEPTALGYVVAIIAVAAVAVSMDLIWFRVWSYENLYKPAFRAINRADINMATPLRMTFAVLSWLMIGVGAAVLAAPHATDLAEAFGYGCIFGAVAYSIYNFTNAATISPYPVQLVLMDTLWGTIVGGVGTLVAWSIEDAL